MANIWVKMNKTEMIIQHSDHHLPGLSPVSFTPRFEFDGSRKSIIGLTVKDGRVVYPPKKVETEAQFMVRIYDGTLSHVRELTDEMNWAWVKLHGTHPAEDLTRWRSTWFRINSPAAVIKSILDEIADVVDGRWTKEIAEEALAAFKRLIPRGTIRNFFYEHDEELYKQQFIGVLPTGQKDYVFAHFHWVPGTSRPYGSDFEELTVWDGVTSGTKFVSFHVDSEPHTQ